MATVIDQIRDDITDKAGTLVWSAALVAALGDPKEWEYTGDCVQGDPGKTHCACGCDEWPECVHSLNAYELRSRAMNLIAARRSTVSAA